MDAVTGVVNRSAGEGPASLGVTSPCFTAQRRPATCLQPDPRSSPSPARPQLPDSEVGLVGAPASTPASAPPSTAGAVFFILVGVVLLSAGTVIATDYRKAASRFHAKAMSTQRSKPARIYGAPPAGPSLLRVIGLFQILGGTGLAAVGVHFLSR